MRFHNGIENRQGELWVGGVQAVELARCFGTPLYIYDAATIQSQCDTLMTAAVDYPSFTPYYASKALPNTAICKLMVQAGLGIDVASLGELKVALQAGATKLILHGVYKPEPYLELGIKNSALIVIDSLAEIAQVAGIAQRLQQKARVVLRVNPGVAGDSSHPVTTAGDTKFGIPLWGGGLFTAAAMLPNYPHLQPVGLHCHVGSQLGDTSIFNVTSRLLLEAVKRFQALGVPLEEINLGGGFGAFYREGVAPASRRLAPFVQEIFSYLAAHCGELSLPLPHLSLELGRSLVAEAAVALYQVVAEKTVPWKKISPGTPKEISAQLLASSGEELLNYSKYIIIDGGLYDNPRPLLYGSLYDAVLPSRLNDTPVASYTISGMSCETDTIIHQVQLPQVQVGEYLAIPSAGAYQVSMASNYQRMPKPAVLLVEQGEARLIQRRQSLEEVLAQEVWL
ncbi:MAG: diaminopimelate decarboxylase [Symbiobacteriaceae bacterium]|nr:diaminopimelate decarboxylase [Symbiobacteriaceae bacterium]